MRKYGYQHKAKNFLKSNLFQEIQLIKYSTHLGDGMKDEITKSTDCVNQKTNIEVPMTSLKLSVRAWRNNIISKSYLLRLKQKLSKTSHIVPHKY